MNTGSRATGGRGGAAPTVWLVDWLDSEQEDYEWAWRTAGLQARTIRVGPLGPSVGTHTHRLHSYPGYLSLAAQGLTDRSGAPVVAWQHIAGALAGVLRPRRRPRLVVFNPILDADRQTVRQRFVLAGIGRTDRIIVISRAALDTAIQLGVPSSMLEFLPMGVRPHREEATPPGDYFLAAGRDSRDWDTLAKAAEGLDREVIVTGPASLPRPGPLRLAPQVQGADFFRLLEGAAALVLPFARTERPIGHQSMLAAISVGRGIVATQSQGIEDYVDSSYGLTVPPRDPEALREALRSIDAAKAAELARNAFQAAVTRFSLTRFVTDVERVARAT